MKTPIDILIDYPDEARAARAELDARAIANRVFFTQADKLRLLAFSFAVPDEFGVPGDVEAEVTVQ